ncbi:MAG TPA: dihydroneopterin aldolase [Spirochaetota bacterium]|mgnify:CR=1 FL=1|nr:dihydroneopterin aldolase [Spirochaetota bacterium]
MVTIKIKNLKLQTIIGIHDYERQNKQDIIINIKIKIDDAKATVSDDINDTLDYDKLSKKIIKEVENSNFFLIEKLTDFVLNIIFEEHKVKYAKVSIDKPNALKSSDSVSTTKSKNKKH